MPLKHKLIAIAITLGIFILAWVYVNEFHWFSNTLELTKLLVGSAIFCAAIGIMIGWHFIGGDLDRWQRIQDTFACFSTRSSRVCHFPLLL